MSATSFAPTLVSLLAGLLWLSWRDIRTRTVNPWVTAAFAAVIVTATSFAGANWQQGLWGVAVAAGAFIIYLEAGVAGKVGGGDVKLVPVPAFVFGVWHPLLGMWWLVLTFGTHLTMQLWAARGKQRGEQVAVPHVPAMLVAAACSCAVGLAVPFLPVS